MTKNPCAGVGKWAWPLGGALFCLSLGTASGLASAGGDGEWYRILIKPPGTPPPWVFGPVWSVLYIMMGVALGRLIHRRAWSVVVIFAAQFVLNLVWTPIFFGMHQVLGALAVIIALMIGLIFTICHARPIDRWAVYLLLPYLIWVGYATYLNAGFFWLNR